jgi:3-oxoacyl-[acyl-carrier-protein] synthase II
MAYIKDISIISPQKTSGDRAFPDEIISYSGPGYMKCIEPAYREFIDPMVGRRMSRIVKMGVYSAMKCMHDTGINAPDAIIAGTGLGCLEDTEKFLTSIYNSEEKLLNPTPFIQSTHNTIAGAIALSVKCHSYNATYTQRGFSFESALQDALLQLNEIPSRNILVGGFDEVTETSFALTSRLGLWKNHETDSNKLYDYNTRGSLSGECAAFLMLSGSKGEADTVRIRLFKTFYGERITKINDKIEGYLKEDGMESESIDLILLGKNGDSRNDHFYDDLLEGLLRHKPVTGFKHLCGEFDTSAVFALWLARLILIRPEVTGSLKLLNDNKMPKKVNSIMIYNHLRGKYHSIYVLERC